LSCKSIIGLPLLGVCGSFDTAFRFGEFVRRINPDSRSGVTPNNANCFKFQAAGTIAQSVLRVLGYSADTVSLPRKKVLALKALTWVPHHHRTPANQGNAG
jgi:hypothetical protein